MIGTIRSKDKCPMCFKNFMHIQKLGFICPEHKTIPKRFYIDFWWQRKRIRVFSDKQGQPLDSYNRALNLQSKIHNEIEDNGFDSSKYFREDQEKFFMSNILRRFLLDKIDSISPSTRGHYERHINIAIQYFKTTDIREIRKIDITDYKKYLIEKYYPNQPKQGKTLKNVLDQLKTFFIYCYKEYEVIDKVPQFPNVEVQPYQFNWVGPEIQIELLEMVDDHDKPFVVFLMLHGCRPGEARALKCKDINLQHQIITISATFSDEEYMERRKGRGAKPVVIPIHPEIYGFLEDRVRNNLPEAFIFTNKNGSHYKKDQVYRLWEKARQKAGIGKELRLYDVTRHSFASQLVNSNTSIFKVSRLLGHSSVKMTEKYAHHDITALKTDIQKLSLKKEAKTVVLRQ